MTTATALLAADVVTGDVLVSRTLSGADVRARVSDVTRHAVRIDYPGTGRPSETFDVVRLHFGGGSEDYAPDLGVLVVR